MKMMKDFPVFKTLLSSPDVKRELKRYYDLQNAHKKQIATAFGVNITVEKALPPNSALFIDHKKRIVGIYRDGKVVYLSREHAVNRDLRYPTTLKKREVENRMPLEEAG